MDLNIIASIIIGFLIGYNFISNIKVFKLLKLYGEKWIEFINNEKEIQGLIQKKFDRIEKIMKIKD
ncbi:MAG: hypothetical protein ABFC34_13860 [Methanobacterium sp.]